MSMYGQNFNCDSNDLNHMKSDVSYMCLHEGDTKYF